MRAIASRKLPVADEVRGYQGGNAVSDCFAWLRQHQLGRKRLLDTLLAASFRLAKVTRVTSNNGLQFTNLDAQWGTLPSARRRHSPFLNSATNR